MSNLSLPIRELVREHTAMLLTYAFSRSSIEALYSSAFVGNWATLGNTLLVDTKARAERACLELALLLRYLDDEEEFGAYVKARTNFSFGRLVFPGDSRADLSLRDVANKIIHATGYTWEESASTKQPMLVCHSREPSKWLRAEVELVHLAAVCGNLDAAI